MAQRLARRACPDCAVPLTGPLTADEARLAKRYGVEPLVRIVGCNACSKSGYRGRLPVLEVLVSTPAFEELVATGAPAARLQKAAAVGGVRSLADNAVDWVRQGKTTLQEVDRVIGAAGAEPEASEPRVTRILLVDDDDVNRTIARTVLEKNGYSITEAVNGVAALAQLEAGSGFALMVLDLDMPGMGGREVLTRVRKTVATAGLPVLVLTGSSSEDLEAQLMDDGADDYIRKPFEPGRFVARVKAALRRAGE